MPNEEDFGRANMRRRVINTAGVSALAVMLVILHVFVIPLDVLWFAALRRFGIE